MSDLKYITGDLVRDADDYDVIIHGCNCFCTMGAGIARSIAKKWPGAYVADCETRKGDKGKLGKFTTYVDGDLTIINAYTQYHYYGKDLCDYEAIRSVMRELKVRYHGKKFGLPLIGAGLAGGDWSKIEAIIADELAGEDVTIVEFEQNK